MGKLSKKEDVQHSRTAMEGGSGSADYIKLVEGDNFVAILDENYVEGYEHWFEPTEGKRRRLICQGGVDGGGFAPDDCRACARVKEHYEKKKEFKDDGDDESAKVENTAGNNLRAKYRVFFKAVKAEIVQVRKAGKKKAKPDFSEASVQKLGLTDAMFKMLLSLVEDDRYEQIQSEEDLVGLVFNFKKERNKKKKYIEVKEIYPIGRIKTDKYDLKEVDIKDEFEQMDDDTLKKILDQENDYEEDDEDINDSGADEVIDDEEFDEDDIDEEQSDDDFDEDDDGEEGDDDDGEEFFDDDEDEKPAKKKKSSTTSKKKRSAPPPTKKSSKKTTATKRSKKRR